MHNDPSVLRRNKNCTAQLLVFEVPKQTVLFSKQIFSICLNRLPFEVWKKGKYFIKSCGYLMRLFKAWTDAKSKKQKIIVKEVKITSVLFLCKLKSYLSWHVLCKSHIHTCHSTVSSVFLCKMTDAAFASSQRSMSLLASWS